MFFSSFRNTVQSSNNKFRRNFTMTYHLSPGNYVVVAQTRRKSVEFLLRIFLKMPDSDRYRSLWDSKCFILLNFIKTHCVIMGSSLCIRAACAMSLGTRYWPHSRAAHHKGGARKSVNQEPDHKQDGSIARWKCKVARED